MNWYLKLALAALIVLFVPCGLLIVGYYFQKTQKPISISEFIARLKKLQ